ncbi:MAG: hypothetical protein JW841_11965 [Deltaproteobacteria bacterium]|nr:hypothetical protein [Deltaproteobacteria bacterium]
MQEKRADLHPAIAQLIKQVVTDDKNQVSFAPAALVTCRRILLNELLDDVTAFLHLLVTWSRFYDTKIEPASTQLYELVRLFPQVQEAKNKEELLRLGRKAATIAKEDSLMRITSNLNAPQGKSVGLRPQKKRS